MPRESALDFDSLARRLQSLADERGWRLSVESRTTSTNDEVRSAMRLAEGAVPCVALAATQTAGVGRRGARWLSGPGDGLWFSVAVPAESRPVTAPPSLALAGELAERLRRGGVPVELKWPNDLYLDGGKLGGLMLERARFGGRVAWLAGVGINWRLPAESSGGELGDDYRPAALESVPGGEGPADTVDLALELIASAVDLLASPARWGDRLERLRCRHRWFDVPVEVLPERGEAYRGVGGEICADGRLEIRRDDGRRVAVGPNDRVRAAPLRS
ncbi:biotin--[acetyl-CoA-carboxylase] ligase [Guyparkeria hydrothermalis]|uniref:biotin--[acetyl-CoA-carboxylase] ligase n=1 Tax=Guyparkeria hydrothermalis TaxID=923 RepID=UPI0020210CA5|nr:biotin--[acetyl-CoA-carboxylase] ligase [Guyparkeria hydrothermalis]MCL7744713.1 biotin--[acetyl-CoA-carboxylase] ligase [Guyparkeria hydrothermalis]